MLANTPAAYTVRSGYDQAIADANVMPVPQDVTFASRDPQMPDAKLAGWWIPADNGRRAGRRRSCTASTPAAARRTSSCPPACSTGPGSRSC